MILTFIANGTDNTSDPEERKVIDTLVGFVARNGPDFEASVKTKEASNPKFAFLFGGPYHAYYKWMLFLVVTSGMSIGMNK